MAELRKTEIKTDFSTESRHQTIGGISCPIHEAALKAIRDMKKEAYNYLQFKIDLDEEKIHIVTAKNIQVYELAAQVPKDHARYHIYLFKHTHESDYLESFVFIYSMPGYNCSVKERMIYSSSKAPFLESLQKLGMEITKKVFLVALK